jgi:predicted aminopeptidase
MKQWMLAALALLLAGCSHLAYYGHLARGQLDLLGRRQDIARLVTDPQVDAALAARLRKVQEARTFASRHLGLPDNASYTQYAELDRPYVVWNVLAAAEFSVAAVEHCFLWVGCLAYRGYFDEARARAEAARLTQQGLDASVTGVPAYSTLGWFSDPLLSSMLHWSDEWLIGTLFHELAHQQLYVKDDTAFNESFASFVEEEGLRQYLAASGGSSDEYRLLKQRQQQFVALALAARGDLEQLYASGMEEAAMRAAKRQRFERLRADYEALRDGEWSGWNGYDRWFSEPLNNARLVPFALYDAAVPAFAALFARAGRDWTRFYAAAHALGQLPEAERTARLASLAAEPRN